jgi:cell wall-associated NlpC family hydrolase
LALAWPGSAAPAQKKKVTAKRPTVSAKKRVVKKRVVAKKKRRRGAVAFKPSKPQNFATVPVKTELKACSTKDRPSSEAALCLNCAEQALSTANAFTGLRYRRGGTNPNIGFDCSGFVRHVFLNSCGRALPRTAREQFEMGEAVEKDQLQRGDLVFFSSRQGWHVGIYTGNNSFIHSPNRKSSIKESSLDTPYYKRMYKGARRLGTDISPMVVAEAGSLPSN